MKKVLLISSPSSNESQKVNLANDFPMGLLSLATYLGNKGYDVKILDYKAHCEHFMLDYLKGMNDDVFDKFLEDRLRQDIKQFSPDIIGIGCLFSGAFRNLLKIANKIKDIDKSIPIAIGGIHPTLFAGEILQKYSAIDYIVIGEGELTFYKLIQCLDNNDKEKLEFLNGVAFRNNGNVVKNDKTEFIEDLDTLPIVDYSFVDIEDYKRDTSQWYSPKKIKVGQPFDIITSRSCPNKCTFCSVQKVHGRRLRLRSPEIVLDEIEYVYHKYGCRCIRFMDDNLTFRKEHALKIFNGIVERKIDIQFDTPGGVSIKTLDEDIIEAMVRAGLARISLPIESGSDFIRNQDMKKLVSSQKIYEVADIISKYNHVFIYAFFVIGMPHETHQTLQETFEMIKKLPLDGIGVYYATPYPGTELFNYCLSHNLLKGTAKDYMDISDLLHSADEPHFAPHELTKEDLILFRNRLRNYMEEKRNSVKLPHNYPLRYTS